MPQTLEIPEDVPPTPRSRQTLEIPQSPQLQRLFAGPPSPTEDPRRYDLPLQETPEDPAFAIANAATGGGAFAPSLLKGLFLNAAINKATDKAVQTLNDYFGAHRSQIPERFGQSAYKGWSEQGDPSRGYPLSSVEDWYTPEHYQQAEAYSPYRTRETEKLHSPIVTGAYGEERGIGKTHELEPLELGEPSLLRTSMAPMLPRESADPAYEFGYSMMGANPLDLIWHGLSLTGSPNTALDHLMQMRQTGGMTKGYFNRTPVGHFGPLWVGADPRDLPPLSTNPRTLREDPVTEITPKWTDRWGEKEMTAGGREVPPITVHPSKLAVIDPTGTHIGSVADYRPGLEHGEERTMIPKRFQEYSRKPIGEHGVIGSPQEAQSAKMFLQEELKNLPKGKKSLARQDIKFMLKDINDALRSEKAPIKNWATQHLEDIGKLFEEVE